MYSENYTKDLRNKVGSTLCEENKIFMFRSSDRDIIKEAVSAGVLPGLNKKSIFYDFTTVYDSIKNNKYKEEFWYAKYFIIKDFHLYKENQQAMMIKAFLDRVEFEEDKNKYLLISTSKSCIPLGFEEYITYIECRNLNEKDIKEILKSRCNNIDENILRNRAYDFIGLSPKQLNSILSPYKTRKDEFERVLKDEAQWKYIKDRIRSIRVNEAAKDPTIEYVEIDDYTKPLASGCVPYTDFIKSIAKEFCSGEDPNWKTPHIKGSIIAGIPGTGKTTLAKETARLLSVYGGDRVSLVELHMDRLKSSEYGETEKMLTHYLNSKIGKYAPCILLIDELERTLDKNKNHAVEDKITALLLKWLQSNKEKIYVFFTANNVEPIDDALLRGGRINGRYFAFMPTAKNLSEMIYNLLKERITLLDKSFKESLKKDLFVPFFNEITKNEPKFMTGADLRDLFFNTMRKLHDVNPNLASITYDKFRKTFIEEAKSPSFTPYGVTNMKNIAETWLNLYGKYTDINTSILGQFNDKTGTFDKKNDPQDNYDSRMKNTIEKAIEALVKETKQCNRINS